MTIVKITVETDHCVYITRYEETPVLEWKKKNAPLFDILELLSDDKVREWERVYNDNQDAYYGEDDD